MTDDRFRSSSSDELLREARQRVLDGELYSDDHLETSSSDTHGSHTFEDEAPDSTSDDASLDDGVKLSAAEIAAQLAEDREAANPEPPEADTPSSVRDDASADRPRSGMSSLPDWALDDEPAPSAGTTYETPQPSSPQAPSGSLAERIRAIAEQQGEPLPVDIPAGQLQVPPPTDMEGDTLSAPTTEWEARQAEKSSKATATSWIKPVISLVVFAVFGFGFIAAQLDGSEPIDQLAVGDCFEAGDAAEVYSVPVVDCGELHSSELYATVEITAFDSTYPDEEVLFNWVDARCEEQFSAYVGEPYEDSRYWIEVFYPTEDGWDESDRTGLCTVVLVDENLNIRPSLGSARAWGERAA